MSAEYTRKLDFNSDTFDVMKRDMNFVLQRLLGNMLDSETTEGKLTISIDVKLEQEYVPNYNPNIEGESRKVSKPQFKHKVTSAIKINDEKSGNMNSEMELYFDEETGTYQMRPIADTTQRSIFDTDYEVVSEEERNENNQLLIEGAETASLPGPVADAEYEELEDITGELTEDDVIGEDEDFDGYSYEEPEE